MASEGPIRAPVILLAEVAAALSRGVSDHDLAHQMVQQLAQARGVEPVPVGLTLVEGAKSIAGCHRIRGCDTI
jgi:hypothetical protein